MGRHFFGSEILRTLARHDLQYAPKSDTTSSCAALQKYLAGFEIMKSTTFTLMGLEMSDLHDMNLADRGFKDGGPVRDTISTSSTVYPAFLISKGSLKLPRGQKYEISSD